MALDVAFGRSDVTAHQQLGQLAVTLGDRVQDAVVLGESLAWPIGCGRELDTVHAHQLVQLAAEHLDQGLVATALDDAIVKIVVTLLLVVAYVRLKGSIALMGFQHLAQLVDLGPAHALGRQAAGHAFERLADFIEFDEFGVAQ